MLSRIDRGYRWLRREPQSDILAALILLVLSLLYGRLTWLRGSPIYDQGWYMQVAARLAGGEVLYRDVSWLYGPLPVYLLALLYRLFGVDVVMFSILGQVLASLACLLVYRIARFLLPVSWALLGTIVLFLSGWWGGFHSYFLAYTGAASLGAVLGLLFVVCLLSYFRDGKALWLVGAGFASGAAFLTKPEFALACAATGTVFLTTRVIFPAGFASHRAQGVGALGLYTVSAAVVTGVGYGILAQRAGWSQILAGVTGYGRLAYLIDFYAPWGTLRSWLYVASGLGGHLLIVIVLIGILEPATIRKHALALGALLVGSLALVVLPWMLLFLLVPGWWSYITTSKLVAFREGLTVVHAPWTLLLLLVIVVLGLRWLKAYRRRQVISRSECSFAVLVVYSALVAARSYFNPTHDLIPYYADTWFPVLVFSLAVLIPRAVAHWQQVEIGPSWAYLFLTAILLTYAAAGLTWDLGYFSRLSAKVETPRGTVFMPRSRLEIDTLQYILAHTRPEDAIVVFDFASGFYFLSGRRNPLRQDCILGGIGSLPAEIDEIVERLEVHQPRLIIIPRWTEETRSITPRMGVPSGREHYEALMPVWQYVREHYEIEAIVGQEPWAYAIYKPVTTVGCERGATVAGFSYKGPDPGSRPGMP